MDLLDQLAKDFSQDTVLFIGSGVSMPSDLPSWNSLVEWLRDYAKGLGVNLDAADEFIAKEDFINASSAITAELNEVGKSLSDFFIEFPKCEIFKTAEPRELHDLLLRLPTKSIITPNYDLLVEKAFFKKFNEEIQVVHRDDQDGLNSINRSNLKDFLYKYHGCITRPQSIVLNREDYNSLIHIPSAATECLKSLIQSRTFVFIGAGLNDPDFNYLRDYLVQFYKPQNIEFWAFMPNCLATADYYKKKFGTTLINYQNDGDHSELPNKLIELINKINDIDDQKILDVDISIKSQVPTTTQIGMLRQKLINANDAILPIDEKIIGFVSSLNGVERTECEKFLVEYKGFPVEITRIRIDYLVIQNLLKATEHYLLPVRESFSKEAAELIEDELIEYMWERSNG